MKVFVAGHNGLVGSALMRALQAKNYKTITANKKLLDLRDPYQVDTFLKTHKPDCVFIAAAIVGGIQANSTLPVNFLLDNVKIQNNLIEGSYNHKVKKLLFFGSNCMYPKQAPQPFREDSLLTGPFETTNEAYALAKMTGVRLCQYFNKQYGTNFMNVIPTTLYGPNDNYHKEHAHVLPMLMRRFHEAKLRGDKEVVMWGTGTPTREFLHSDDLAQACIMLMEQFNASDIGPIINIGSGFEISIKNLALSLRQAVGLDAEITLDSTKPDGMLRKSLESSRVFSLGWRPKIDFQAGLKSTYQDFLNNPNTRM